jgi:hypothetical protein
MVLSAYGAFEILGAKRNKLLASVQTDASTGIQTDAGTSGAQTGKAGVPGKTKKAGSGLLAG